MGTVISAECNCGYINCQLRLGAGFIDFTSRCTAPAFCEQCQAVVIADYLDADAVCPDGHLDVVFYNDPRLRDGSRDEAASANWWNVPDGRRFVLPADDCRCPSCGQFSMRFITIGFFD